MTRAVDLLVIGAGLAGLTAAWQAAAVGKSVRVIAKGWGATHWHSGCLDVLAPQRPSPANGCDSPASCVTDLIRNNPSHPYALVGLEKIGEALEAFQQLCEKAGYPLVGSLDQNWLLPTAVGAFRPTCMAPQTMIAGDLRRSEPMLIVGFKELDDFFPELTAANLREQGIAAQGMMLSLERLAERRQLNSVGLAALFDKSSFRAEVAELLKPQLSGAKRVGFPAVLGMAHPGEAMADLVNRLQLPLFEIPTLPPSVPGMRLHRIVATAIRRKGGHLYDGMEVVSAESSGGRVTSVSAEAAARNRHLQAGSFILATGGILGGGIVGERGGRLRETIFDLNVTGPDERSNWLRHDYFDPGGHPVFSSGIRTDGQFRPVERDGRVRFQNLYAIGAVLANHDGIRDRSMEGVAIASGYLVGREVGRHETR